MRPDSGKPCFDRSQASDVLRVLGGESEHGGAADVLAEDVDSTDPETGDEFVEVICGDLATELNAVGAGVSESTEIDGEHTMLTGKRWDDTVECPPGFGEAVDQQRARRTRLRGCPPDHDFAIPAIAAGADR